MQCAAHANSCPILQLHPVTARDIPLLAQDALWTYWPPPQSLSSQRTPLPAGGTSSAKFERARTPRQLNLHNKRPPPVHHQTRRAAAMDTNMEDVKMPEPMQLSSAPASEPTTIPTLDGWIESLMQCKQLAESDVQRLCDKVCDDAHSSSRHTNTYLPGGMTGSRSTPGRVERTASGMCLSLLSRRRWG